MNVGWDFLDLLWITPPFGFCFVLVATITFMNFAKFLIWDVQSDSNTMTKIASPYFFETFPIAIYDHKIHVQRKSHLVSIHRYWETIHCLFIREESNIFHPMSKLNPSSFSSFNRIHGLHWFRPRAHNFCYVSCYNSIIIRINCRKYDHRRRNLFKREETERIILRPRHIITSRYDEL